MLRLGRLALRLRLQKPPVAGPSLTSLVDTPALQRPFPWAHPWGAMSLAALGASALCCASARMSRPLRPSSALALLPPVARRGIAAASEPPALFPSPLGAASASGRRSRNARGGRRVCRGAFPGSVRSTGVAASSVAASSVAASSASVGLPDAAEREGGAGPLARDSEPGAGSSRKKRVALWLGYVGTSFRGLQIQPEDYERHTARPRGVGGEGEPAAPAEGDAMPGLAEGKGKGAEVGAEGASDTPTCSVEAVVEEAILRAGLMLPTNFGDLRKLGWSRSSRTDKGVHSVATVLSLKMEVPAGALDPGNDADGDSLASRINEHLPHAVRVFGVLPVSKGFCARSACMSRVYHYLVPLRALLPEGASPAHEDRVRAAPWGEGPQGSTSAWQQHKCSDEEWKAVLDFDRALRTFEGRHAFHNYTVRRIYRSEEGRSRSTQRQKGQFTTAKESAGGDARAGEEEGVEGGPVREEGDEGEELDRRSCVPAQVCNARAAAALSRTLSPGLPAPAGEGLEATPAAPPLAANGGSGAPAALANATAALAEGSLRGSGAESSAVAGQEMEGAEDGAQGAREVGGRNDTTGGAGGAGGTDVQSKAGDVPSEGAGAEAPPLAAPEGQGRYGRKAWWVYAADKDAPSGADRGADRADRIGAAHFRRVQSCRVHLPEAVPGAPGEEERVVDMWRGAPCVRVVIQGESFMLHQIRKMVGTAVGVVRGKIPESLLLPSLARHCRMVLPLAPPHGLILASAVFSPARGPGPRGKAPAPEEEEGEPQGRESPTHAMVSQRSSATLERGGDLLPLPVPGPESPSPPLSPAVKASMDQFYRTQLLPAVAPSLIRPSSVDGEVAAGAGEPWTDWIQNLDFHSWVTEEEVNEITDAMRAWAAHLEMLNSTDTN